jgi:hypothetical protein
MKFSFFRSFGAICLLLVFAFSTKAQVRPIGTWRAFQPYGNAYFVVDGGEWVYCAGQKNIFGYLKSTGEIKIYDKTNGLSDVGVSFMSYSPENKALAVAYANSNLDIILNGTDIYNFPDFKNENATGSVLIRSVSFYGTNAFVSTDLGISVIDLVKKEIRDNYVIGNNGSQVTVYATAVDGNNIYAATKEGVKYAPFSSQSLQNYTTWQTYNYSQHGIAAKSTKNMIAAGQNIFAVMKSTPATHTDTLYKYNAGTWQKIYTSQYDSITELSAYNGTMYFAIHRDSAGQISGRLGKVAADGTVTIIPSAGARPDEWFEDNGIIWIADLYAGLQKSQNGSVQNIVPNGPFSSNSFSMDLKDNTLFVTAGGVDGSWGYTFNQNGFYMFDGANWQNFNSFSLPSISGYYDIMCVAAAPAIGKTYLGSYLSGLIVFDNTTKQAVTYDKDNSILEGQLGDSIRTKISALAMDNNNNLWIGNAGTQYDIKVLGADGTWYALQVPYGFDLMKRITIDQQNQLWAPLRSSSGPPGVLVYTYGADLANTADDQYRVMRAGEGAGGLPNDNAYCIVEDKEGNIWVGTDEGICVFYCPGSVFSDGGCDAERIKVERDGYVGYLFGTETVKALAVDPANRKWIGTTNGVWLISADGKDEILKFTTDNSPLPSNFITDITVNKENGEVFIATEGGLVSYQGDAIKGITEGKPEALVYPNPVKPDYDGPIAIKGLVDDAYVKITDAAGVLIYQGRANGGQMIWDGKGYSGNKAASGVYIVYSSTDLGKQRSVAKILFIN